MIDARAGATLSPSGDGAGGLGQGPASGRRQVGQVKQEQVGRSEVGNGSKKFNLAGALKTNKKRRLRGADEEEEEEEEEGDD